MESVSSTIFCRRCRFQEAETANGQPTGQIQPTATFFDLRSVLNIFWIVANISNFWLLLKNQIWEQWPFIPHGNSWLELTATPPILHRTPLDNTYVICKHLSVDPFKYMVVSYNSLTTKLGCTIWNHQSLKISLQEARVIEHRSMEQSKERCIPPSLSRYQNQLE